MLTSVTLAYLSSQSSTSSVMTGVAVEQSVETAEPLAKEDMVIEPQAEGEGAVQ